MEGSTPPTPGDAEDADRGAADPEPETVAEEQAVPAGPSAYDALLDRVQAAERRADELASVSRRQSEMAEELHKDNRRLRDGEIREAIAPLIRGLARVADDLDRIRTARPDDEDLAHIDSRVREVLHDVGASRLRPEVGDAFDPRMHQAAGGMTTADPALDRTVAEVRRDGLVVGDGRILRPADVVVFRLQTAAAGQNVIPTASPQTEADSQ